MMMRLRPYFLLAGLLFFSACATSLPATNYYVLGLPINPSVQGEPALPYSMTIEPFDAQFPLLRRNVVWRSDNQVGYYTFDKWAEIPSRMFTYRLYRRATESNLLRQVHFGVIPNHADFTLRGTLAAFEEVTTPEGTFGRVSVEAALVDPDGAQIWKGIVEQQEPVTGEGAQATVQAVSQAAENAITELLQSIAQALQDYETPPAQ